MDARDQTQQQQQEPALEARKADGISQHMFTEAEQVVVQQAIAILERALERGAALSDPALAGRYMAGKLRHLEHEAFGVLFLDGRFRVIAYEEMFRGTIDHASVHPREVARAALRHNAHCLVVAHNHPSGQPEPSAADRAVTSRLKQALELLDIRLLDHFVIADGPPVSLAARGWV